MAETVQDFGEIVDRIEDGFFTPADLALLQTRLPGTTRTFASEICRRCDTRFSYPSYRPTPKGVEARFRQYFDEVGMRWSRPSGWWRGWTDEDGGGQTAGWNFFTAKLQRYEEAKKRDFPLLLCNFAVIIVISPSVRHCAARDGVNGELWVRHCAAQFGVRR